MLRMLRALLLTMLVAAAQGAEPEVEPLAEAASCTFPANRSAHGFQVPLYRFREADLRFRAEFSFENAFYEIPEAARSGIDYDATPYHFGLSFNGLPARFSGVYLEGLRLCSDSDFSGTNLGIVPPWLLEGLEVTAGPAGSLVGSGGAGGVANFILPSHGLYPSREKRSTLFGLAGNDGIIGAGAACRWETDTQGVDVFASRLYGNIGPVCALPERRDVLGLRWRFAPSAQEKELGLFDALVMGSQGVYETSDDDYLLWKVSYTPPRASFVPVRMFVGGFEMDRTVRDHLALEYYSTVQFRVTLDEAIWGGHTLGAAAWYCSERAERFAMSGHSRSLTGLSLSDEFALGGAWTCLLGTGFERSSEANDFEAAGHAAAVWSGGGMSFRLGFHHTYRFPSLVPQYETMTDMDTWWRDGNPALGPERVNMARVEARNKVNGSLGARAFFAYSRVHNFHHLEPTGGTGPDSDPVYRWEDNLGARITCGGLGLEGKAGPLNWGLSYTNRSGKDDGGVPTSFIPRHVVRADLTGRLGTRVDVFLTSETVVDATGPRPEHDFGPNLDPYTVVNLGFSWRPSDVLTWGLSLYNLFGESVQVFEYGYEEGVRPRSVAVSLRYSF